MKRNTFKFKEDNILCHRCVINAVRALSEIPEVEEFNVDINTKMIEIIYRKSIHKEAIRSVINDCIISGKVKSIIH